MITFSSKELALLCSLNLNCRRGARELGKESGFTQTFVQSKINDFVKQGIITKFVTKIDYTLFGFSSYKIDLYFQNISPKAHSEVVEYLIDRINVHNVAMLDENFGISIRYLSKTYSELNEFILNFKERFGNYLSKFSIKKLREIRGYPKAYLLGKSTNESDWVIALKNKNEKFVLDELDRKILHLLSNDARISLINISRNMNVPSRTINYRIKRMEKEKIILAYRAIINIKLINYKIFKIILELTTYSDRIERFSQTNPDIVWFEQYAPSTYELLAEVSSIENMVSLIENIHENFFPIKSYKIKYISDIKKDGVFVPV